MKPILKIAVVLAALASSPLASLAQQPAQYVGIPSGQMNYYSASQQNYQWCWAAVIQMVMNYYGVNISQQQIVARTYGVGPGG